MAFFKKKKEYRAVFCLCYWVKIFFFTTVANCLFAELEQSCRKPSTYTSALCALHAGVARVCVRSWIPTNWKPPLYEG